MAINNHPDIHEQVICANVFIRKDGKYLLLRRSPLKKYAPNVVHPVGGKVDLGENPYQTAKRETLEETGITIKNIRLEAVLLEIEPHLGEPYDWVIYHFSADYESGEVIDTEEGELALLAENEIQHENLFPSVELILDKVLNPSCGTVFATIEYDAAKEHIVKYTLDSCVV